MEETRMREDCDGEVKEVRAAAAEEEEDGVMAWLIADESEEFTADELMRLLEEKEGEGATSPPLIEDSAWSGSFRVRFIEDPYAAPVVFQSPSSGYITINGNEESCGPSFSDSEASVMASVDARGLYGIARYFSDRGGAWGAREGEARGEGSNNTEAFDDDLLARFLGEEDCV